MQAALADPTTHDDMKADHDAMVSSGGFGVPTIVFPDDGQVYVPVAASIPAGDDALALWDLTVAYSKVPFLYEIRTPKSDADMPHICEVFEPYLTARDWESKEMPAR